MGGGKGRCRREAASFSPGDSNATAGNPYVAPNKLASAPPRECPTSQTLAEGYISMRSSMSFWKYISLFQVRKRKTKRKHTSSVKEAKTHNTNGIEQAILDEGICKAFVITPPIISIASTNGLECPRDVNACAAARK